MAKYLDENGLLYLWSKIKAAIPTRTSSLTNDSGFITSSSVPGASSTTPKMDGTAAAGSESTYARGDHVHPSDSSKLGTSGNGSNVTVAFTAASTRANIATGEKLSVTFGKLAKWFSDLKTVAFSGSYTDLSNKPTIPTKTSQLTNDSELVDLDSLNTWADTTIPEYGYQTASEVRTIVTGYGYQTAANVKNTVEGYGYQTAAQVQSAINTSVATVYKYKGSVAAVSNLPTSGNAVGDVYNVTATGMNYVWTGSAWDALGSELNVEAITNAQIDTIVAS